MCIRGFGGGVGGVEEVLLVEVEEVLLAVVVVDLARGVEVAAGPVGADQGVEGVAGGGGFVGGGGGGEEGGEVAVAEEGEGGLDAVLVVLGGPDLVDDGGEGGEQGEAEVAGGGVLEFALALGEGRTEGGVGVAPAVEGGAADV
jgi:hypothetical protein